MNVLDLGVELELGILFALAAVAGSIFDKFEVETAGWRKLLRWAFAAALTLGSFHWIGHWSLALLGGFAALGAFAHAWWCAKNGIHALTAQPRRKYYELRGWQWPPS